MSKKAIVIGSGFIGAFSAYYLHQKGWQVTLLEQGLFGSGSSHGNCGLILPTHILPLTMPGTVQKALKWMRRKDAPFYIRPRVDFGLANWLIRFARHCNMEHVLKAATARSTLLEGSIDVYADLLKKESIDCDFAISKILFVFKNAEGFQQYKATHELEQQFGVHAKAVSGEALRKLEPALSNDVAGAWMYERTAHLRPDFLLRELKRVFSKQNIEIMENTRASTFLQEDGQAVAVDTNRGRFEADAFVVATGAWTPLLKKPLGYKVPIQPGKGYSMTMKTPDWGPAIPCIFAESKVVATPWNSGLRLGGTMEFSGYDDALNPTRIDALPKQALAHFRNTQATPSAVEPEEKWCGWRPMTHDGLPVIDFSPRHTNVLIAAGHNMIGLSTGPATGRLVSQMLNGDKPELDPHPFSLRRF
jgi:D-amino-acid dehydrogenase